MAAERQHLVHTEASAGKVRHLSARRVEVAVRVQLTEAHALGYESEGARLEDRGVRLVEERRDGGGDGRRCGALLIRGEAKDLLPAVGREVNAVDHWRRGMGASDDEGQLLTLAPDGQHVDVRRPRQAGQRMLPIQHRRQFGDERRGLRQDRRKQLLEVRTAIGQRKQSAVAAVASRGVDIAEVYGRQDTESVLGRSMEAGHVVQPQGGEVVHGRLERRAVALHVNDACHTFGQARGVYPEAAREVAEAIDRALDEPLLVTRRRLRGALLDRPPRGEDEPIARCKPPG